MSVSGGSWLGANAGLSQTPQLTSLFHCDGCEEQIPAHKARIHCQTCHDYDLCASCFVTGVTTGNHVSYHPTTVIKQSGKPPVPSSAQSPSVPATQTQFQSPTEHQRTASNDRPSPTSPLPAPASSNVPPPQFPPPPQRSPVTPALPPRNSHLPPLPPPRTAPRVTSTTQNGGWQPLFNGNLASPTFVALLNDIFTYLDRGRTGYLSPEVYSSWLDAQGYRLEHNVWKKALTPVFGQNKEDIADFEWKSSLDNFSIEHIMAPRQAAANNDMSNLVAGMNNVYLNSPGVQQIMQMSKPRSVSGGQMPLMTRKGFIDITTIEVLYDPSAGWNNLNQALRVYGIWQDKGPLPREMLPQYPPQAILDQVKRISEMARYKANQQLNAKNAELRMKQRGQQMALDLLDDRRYYYC